MTKNLRDIPEIGALLQHSAGEGVAKKVGSDLRWPIDTCLHHGTTHNMADARGTRERHTGGVRTQENALRGPTTTISTQIARHRSTDVTRQWQEIQPFTLASNQDFGRPPADVPQFQRNDFTGTETQLRQQEQDHIITPTGRRSPIWRREHSRHPAWCAAARCRPDGAPGVA